MATRILGLTDENLDKALTPNEGYTALDLPLTFGNVATRLGGGSTYNSGTRVISAPSYTVQGSSHTNVGSAISALNTAIGNAGSVTSVGVSVPTGFSVSGSPVTGAGTINISYASGYQGFTTTLKNKLDGIQAGAQVNVGTNLAQGTRTATTVPVTSSTGTNATLAVATTSLAGVMSAADKTKLNDIAAGATVGADWNTNLSNIPANIASWAASSPGDYVTIATNQTVTGNKIFSGVLTSTTSSGIGLVVERTNSANNSLIQYSTTGGSVYAGLSSGGSTFAIGGGTDLTNSANRWLTVNANTVTISNDLNVAGTVIGLTTFAGHSTSWGNPPVGGIRIKMGEASGATWMWHGYSGTTFRGGVQLNDFGSTYSMRLWTGDTFAQLTNGVWGYDSIPSLNIGKITGLQNSLDGKMPGVVNDITNASVEDFVEGISVSSTNGGTGGFSGWTAVTFKRSNIREAQLQFSAVGGSDSPEMWFRTHHPSSGGGGWTGPFKVYHSGNFATGTTSQYIRGDGSLATFPTTPAGTVTSVSAGNGMNFSTITGSGAVTLGTPGTLSGTTTNSVSSTSHTHALSANLKAWDGVTTSSKVDTGNAFFDAYSSNPEYYPSGSGFDANDLSAGRRALITGSLPNTPTVSGVSHWYIESKNSYLGATLVQTALSYSGASRFYTRRFQGGSWSDWTRYLTDTDVNPSDYVTLSTAQSISGAKTFLSPVTIRASGNSNRRILFTNTTSTLADVWSASEGGLFLEGGGHVTLRPNLASSVGEWRINSSGTFTTSSAAALNLSMTRTGSTVNSIIETATSSGSIYFGQGGSGYFSVGDITNLSATYFMRVRQDRMDLSGTLYAQGAWMGGAIETYSGNRPLSFYNQTNNHSYIQWFNESDSLTRSAFVGFGSQANTAFTIVNERAGAHINLITYGGGISMVNGNEIYHTGNFNPATKADLNPTALGSGVDLDTIVTTGVYHQSSNANALNGTNYPVPYAGLLEVTQMGIMVYQRYWRYGTNLHYSRAQYNGNWTVWQQTWTEASFDPASKANSSITITAGNGLSGGGNLGANRTISLGTPGTLSGSTTNSVSSNSHTHAISLSAGDITGLANTATIAADQSSTGSTIVWRNSSSDVFARLFRSEYANQTTISGAMAFRINSATDNYIRFCSDTGAIRNYLGLANSATIEGTNTSTANTIVVRNSGGDAFVRRILVDDMIARQSAGVLYFRPNGSGSSTGQMTLTTAGVAAAVNFSATSDRRKKKNIETYTARHNLTDLIRLCTYLWRDNDEIGLGVIAQEVQEIAPEYVFEDDDGVLSVDKAGLALECVIGLSKRVSRLEMH